MDYRRIDREQKIEDCSVKSRLRELNRTTLSFTDVFITTRLRKRWRTLPALPDLVLLRYDIHRVRALDWLSNVSCTSQGRISAC